MTLALADQVTSIVFPPDVWADINRAVLQGHRIQREVGRLLTGRVRGGRALAAESVECPNWNGNPSRFRLPVSDIEAAQSVAGARGLRVLGILHTHPSGIARQSLSDLEMVRVSGLLSLIAAFDFDAVRVCCYGYFRNRIRPVSVAFLPSTHSHS